VNGPISLGNSTAAAPVFTGTVCHNSCDSS
jgi:hypothetical protein